MMCNGVAFTHSFIHFCWPYPALNYRGTFVDSYINQCWGQGLCYGGCSLKISYFGALRVCGLSICGKVAMDMWMQQNIRWKRGKVSDSDGGDGDMQVPICIEGVEGVHGYEAGPVLFFFSLPSVHLLLFCEVSCDRAEQEVRTERDTTATFLLQLVVQERLEQRTQFHTLHTKRPPEYEKRDAIRRMDWARF